MQMAAHRLSMTQPEEAKDSAAPNFEGSPLAHLRETIQSAASSSEGDRLLVLTHRGPDPDAIGSLEGVRFLLERSLGIKADIVTVGRIHRAENLALVRALNLEFGDYEEVQPEQYFGSLLVDTQPGFGHTVIPADIPLLGVLDHHVTPEGDAATSRVAHLDVRLGVGATSTIVWDYIRESGLELDQTVATALFCGIRYDTKDLSRNVSSLDEEAYYATFRQADRGVLPEIHNPPLPQRYYSELHRALDLASQHGPLVICLLGEVSHPEFVAEMADFFLRMRGASWVVVGGFVEEEGEYVISLRTDQAFGNAYPLLQRVLGGEGSFGGHGHISGGRIPIESAADGEVEEIEERIRTAALAVIGKDQDGETGPLERDLI